MLNIFLFFTTKLMEIFIDELNLLQPVISRKSSTKQHLPFPNSVLYLIKKSRMVSRLDRYSSWCNLRAISAHLRTDAKALECAF